MEYIDYLIWLDEVEDGDPCDYCGFLKCKCEQIDNDINDIRNSDL